MTEALAVVAHYDDALIWAGGAIARSRRLGWSWTVVALCVGEVERRGVFDGWCRALDVRGIALTFRDHPDGRAFSRNDPKSLRGAILGEIGEASFDWVFTHSPDPEGEYGFHPNHAEAAETVAALCEEGLFDARRVVRFAYRRIRGRADLPTVVAPDASWFVLLDYEELSRKAEWCRRAHAVELHDPALGGRSWLERLAWPCPNPEAFEGEGLRLPAPFIGSEATSQEESP